MALSGLEIFKLLPKTNCKKCGFPTCLAFAMQLAAKKVSLDKCPDVSEESKAALDGASAPPIKLVTIGNTDKKVAVGNETVLFRHEETFYHQPGIAIRLKDNLTNNEIMEKLEVIKKLSFERVGLILEPNLIALEDVSGTPNQYADKVKLISENINYPLVLISESPEVIDAALKIIKDKKPLICGANSNNYEGMTKLAKESECPLVVKANNLEELDELVSKVTKLGVNDLILDPGGRDLRTTLNNLTLLRRLALKKGYRQLGYPIITFPSNTDEMLQPAEVSIYIAKYAGIVVTDAYQPWQILPLVTGRQDIYTDPRKPLQAESKVYEIGAVDRNSPVLVTTNFSLTYFTIAGEIEACKVPAYLFLVNTEGTSVLTAWAADKFTSETITKTLEKLKVADLVDHRTLIIPGLVSIISGKLQEESGWKVQVGPKEASGIAAFLRDWKAA